MKLIVCLLVCAIITTTTAFGVYREPNQSFETLPSFQNADECHKCLDGSSCCDDGAQAYECCAGGEFCCPTAVSAGSGSSCCNGTCCIDGETCCDSLGESGVCCITQTSFCCSKVHGSKFPSRCCPRWTVCCEFEDLGCCDPALIASGHYAAVGKLQANVFDERLYWLNVLVHSAPLNAERVHRIRPETSHSGAGAGAVVDNEQKHADSDDSTTTLYAMFVEGISGELESRRVDAASGQQSFVNKVPQFNTFGEATRPFQFDRKRQLFYVLEANFTAPPASAADPQRPITLYTINPATGESKATPVRNADNQVTGFAYCAGQDVIVMATRWYSTQGEPDYGFKFWWLDVNTGVATSRGSVVNAQAADKWSGYISAVASDCNTLHRVGYGNVVTGQAPGVGTTVIGGATVSPQWATPVPQPRKLGFYLSASLLPDDRTFVSLAPDEFTGALSVVRWTLQNATVVAPLGNAHTVPLFGQLAETLSADGSTYAALVVDDKRKFWRDKWEISVVNLASGNSTTVEMTPHLNAGANSISGIGFL